ncbi:hypothetical protein PV327_007297 [Microctonus hyperodae]|uniref:Uncharacterized protein n=1 Tax=Microctonus hyperodae TaxID=165561 RepID=A0AA39F622_MICHY|nr:hypothetical protein PV327_007297 [Microctonus hyperodae]
MPLMVNLPKCPTIQHSFSTFSSFSGFNSVVSVCVHQFDSLLSFSDSYLIILYCLTLSSLLLKYRVPPPLSTSLSTSLSCWVGCHRHLICEKVEETFHSCFGTYEGRRPRMNAVDAVCHSAHSASVRASPVQRAYQYSTALRK